MDIQRRSLSNLFQYTTNQDDIKQHTGTNAFNTYLLAGLYFIRLVFMLCLELADYSS
jgi:hypothetical protein